MEERKKAVAYARTLNTGRRGWKKEAATEAHQRFPGVDYRQKTPPKPCELKQNSLVTVCNSPPDWGLIMTARNGFGQHDGQIVKGRSEPQKPKFLKQAQ